MIKKNLVALLFVYFSLLPNPCCADESSPLVSLWNGFIEIVNILEVANSDSKDQDITVKYLRIDGTLGEKLTFKLSPGEQRDIILNDLATFTKDSYGLVLVYAEGGTISGRISYYKYSLDRRSFDFVFSIPLNRPVYRETISLFNTHYPIAASGGGLTANWLTIVNMADGTRSFTLLKRDAEGHAISESKVITLGPFERLDYEAGHVIPGPASVGSIVVIPEKNDSPYLAKLMRYGLDASNKQQYAFALETTAAVDGPLYAPVRRVTLEGAESLINWLEVLNASSRESEVTVVFRSAQGEVIHEEHHFFPPGGQRHFPASIILGAHSFGTAEIRSSEPSSLAVQSMFYLLNKDQTKVFDIYGTRALERSASQRDLTLSWNSFLGMKNLLTLLNPHAESQQVDIRVFSITGEPQLLSIQIPGFGLSVVPISSPLFAMAVDSYGSLAVRKGVQAEVLRISSDSQGVVDFVNNTLPVGADECDSDEDGTPDLYDHCPKDPAKIEPDMCGCYFPDKDSDGDGFIDCMDECPLDSTKNKPGDSCGPVFARIKFFIAPEFVTDTTLEEQGRRLKQYVSDINVIFGKNTIRQFTFDPTKDLALWNKDEHIQGSLSPVSYPYDYWLIVDGKDPASATFGSATGNVFNGNSMVAFGGAWDNIYDVEAIRQQPYSTDKTNKLIRYYNQLGTLIHELGHNHGLGGGEYYSLAWKRDNTGVEPMLDLDIHARENPERPYWGKRSLVENDPMLYPTTYNVIDALDVLKFSPLGAEIINRAALGKERHTFANCQLGPRWCDNIQIPSDSTVEISVEIIDTANNQSVAGCAVKVFNEHYEYEQDKIVYDLLYTGDTDGKGKFSFVWKNNPLAYYYNYPPNQARLVKANCPGYKPQGDWITYFDLQAARIFTHGGFEADFHYPGKLVLQMTPETDG